MRQRFISHTDKQQESDRQGWADITDLAYKVHVTGCGEALEGPYYFGRVYEAPPTFTWSGVPSQATGGMTTVIPLLTVGVAEWITDDFGMYVGAYLWFKVKDQAGTDGCDAIVCVMAPDGAESIRWSISTENEFQLGPIDSSIGENLLDDPSFEAYPWADNPPLDAFPVMNMNYTGSPTNSTGLAWLDGSETYDWTQMLPVVEPPGWYHPYSDIDDIRHWKISTEDPRSGTHHAKWTSVDGWGRVPPELAPYGGTSCTARRYLRIYFPYSARVQPGDLVEFTVWAKTFGNSSQLGFIYLDWWDVFGTQVTTSLSDHNWDLSNTEYRKMTYAAVAPEGAMYVVAVADWNYTMAPGDGVYVDDAELKVICNSDIDGHDCGVVFDDNFSTAAAGWPGTLWAISPANTLTVWARSGHPMVSGGSYVYGYPYYEGAFSNYPSTPDPMSPGWSGTGYGSGDSLLSSGNPLATGGWAVGHAISTTQLTGTGLNIVPKVAGYASGLTWSNWSGDYTALVKPGDRVTVTFDAMLTNHLSTTVMRPDNRIKVFFYLAQVEGDGFTSGNHMPHPAVQMVKSSTFNTHQVVVDIPEIDGYSVEGGPYYLYVSLVTQWRSDAPNNYAYDAAGSSGPITKYEEYWIDKVKVEVDCAPTTCRDEYQQFAHLANNGEVEAQVQRIGQSPSGDNDLPALIQDPYNLDTYRYYWPESGQYDQFDPPYVMDPEAVVKLSSGVEGPPWRYTDTRAYQNYYSAYRPFTNMGGGVYGTGPLIITGGKWTCDPVPNYGARWPYITTFAWGDQANITFRYWVDSIGTDMEIWVNFDSPEWTSASLYTFPVTTAGAWVFRTVSHRFRDWDEINSEGHGLWLGVDISARHNGTYTGNFYVDGISISLNKATFPWA